MYFNYYSSNITQFESNVKCTAQFQKSICNCECGGGFSDYSLQHYTTRNELELLTLKVSAKVIMFFITLLSRSLLTTSSTRASMRTSSIICVMRMEDRSTSLTPRGRRAGRFTLTNQARRLWMSLPSDTALSPSIRP